ncbi:MAG: hypothetical protein ACJAUP_000090 [Cellvibrionaceae bacterium]|jgi:hypothetical protein
MIFTDIPLAHSLLIELSNQYKIGTASAGWHTLPYDSDPFPYGLQHSAGQTQDLGNVFSTKLIILLLEKNTDMNHRFLRKTPAAV